MQLDRGTRCLVVGLGASGMAAVRYLHGLGAEVSASEARPKKQIDNDDLAELNAMGVPMEYGGHTYPFFKDKELIVPSPGIPLDLPVITEARSRGVVIAGELALVAGRVSAPVIGVTGSNGKTTVTSLIGHLLQTAGRDVFVGGNIGRPVLDYVREEQPAEVVVLELSSFQLEISGEFRPDIGLLLNISEDHLDRHSTMKEYAAAKRLLFRNQLKSDVAILGADDPLVMADEIATAGTVLHFGIGSGSEARVTEDGVHLSALISGQKVTEDYDLGGTALASQVNRLNAAAAIPAVRILGCSREGVEKGLGSFKPPPHRMSSVAAIGGVRYIDDSKGTNVGAVAAALASCGNRVVLIGGGRNKGGDFRLLRPAVKNHVTHLVLIGEAAAEMEEQLGSLVPVIRADSMAEAVRRASIIARPGDTVLLSPGCASFDMFKSYAHRGEVFQEAVAELHKMQHECC